jgi:hypothetical protein
MSRHPGPDQLLAFATGQAPEDSAAQISMHLADCDSCRTKIDALPSDTLLSLLRKSSSSPEAGGDRQAVTAAGAPVSPTAGADIPEELAAHPKYHVVSLVGTGGMGAVYKAEHRRMERQVALKVINAALMNRPDMVERFHREVKAAAKLTHPNIVTAYDADQAGAVHFLVMEFVEGISLAQRLHQQGRLPVIDACAYVQQAAAGLQHAFEQGMVHRDIKPHNLMLTPRGQVKILDFGLARFAREAVGGETAFAAEAANPQTAPRGLTEVGMLMGTADFIAPEQASDPRRADIRADIYSLGCTLYYLLAGRAPFADGSATDKVLAHAQRSPVSLSKLRGDVPPELARVVDKMMAKDPARRYQTPAQVAEALAPFAQKPRPRRRLLRVAAAAGLMAAAVAAAVMIYIHTDQGVFEVNADDQVALEVNKKGIKIRDLAANREYLLKVGKENVRSGQYELVVSELPAGVEVTATNFVIKRGGGSQVTVRFRGNLGDLRGEALRWFPANATFYGARDMRAFNELSLQQIIVLVQLAQKKGDDRLWKLASIAGDIDRVSFAYVFDALQPDKSRFFVRLTGKLSHERIAEWFRQDWPGAVVSEHKEGGERITLAHSAQPIAPAWAMIGSTDLIMAGYQASAEKHVDVVQQVLDLRAGRGKNLADTQAVALLNLPADSWAFFTGAPPDAFKGLVLFPVLPRSGMATIGGTRDIQVNFRAEFATAADARTFAFNISHLKQQGLGLLKVLPIKPETSAQLTQALSGLQVDGDGARVAVVYRLPGAVAESVSQLLRDLPLSMFQKLGAVIPTKGIHNKEPGMLKKFDASDKPLSQDRVTADQGGWRIEADKKRTVALFEIGESGVEDCTVSYRARLKSTNFEGKAYLEMWCRFPGKGEFFSRGVNNPVSGTTDWASYETPFFLKKGERPDLIKLNLVIEGKGTVWIRDVEVLGGTVAPPPQKEAPFKAGTVKAIGPADKPLAQDRVVAEEGGWRIEAGAKETRNVRLFEVAAPGVDNCMIHYRLQMKTRLAGDAYQEMWCRFPGLGEYFSKGLDRKVSGNTNWSAYSVSFRLEKGQRPELIKLGLIVTGPGQVWIKNVEVVRSPLTNP